MLQFVVTSFWLIKQVCNYSRILYADLYFVIKRYMGPRGTENTVIKWVQLLFVTPDYSILWRVLIKVINQAKLKTTIDWSVIVEYIRSPDRVTDHDYYYPQNNRLWSQSQLIAYNSANRWRSIHNLDCCRSTERKAFNNNNNIAPQQSR